MGLLNAGIAGVRGYHLWPTMAEKETVLQRLFVSFWLQKKSDSLTLVVLPALLDSTMEKFVGLTSKFCFVR